MNDILFALSCALPGRDDEYVEWYRTHHFQEMLAVPGVSHGHFYRAIDDSFSSRWNYAGRFDFSEPFTDVMPRVFGKSTNGEMTLTDSIDSPKVSMLGASPLKQPLVTEGATIKPDCDMCFALTDQSEGEALQALWSDSQIPASISSKGVVSVQLYSVSEVSGRECPWAYLAIFDILPGKGRNALAELVQGTGPWHLPSPNTENPDAVQIGLFECIV